EIDQIRADERQPGWTRWAIFGALASLTWLAINQIEAYRLGATNAAFVTLVIHLNYLFLLAIASFFSLPNQRAERGVRLRPASALLGHGRVHLLWNAARYTILLSVAIVNPLMPSDGSRYLTYLVLIVLIVFLILFVIMSFWQFPFADPSSQ